MILPASGPDSLPLFRRARRCRLLVVRAFRPDDRRRPDVRADRLHAEADRPSGARAPLLLDPPAFGQAADRLPDAAPGPHTGVHLIVVRGDLSTIIHRHPPIARGRPDRRGDRLPLARALPGARRRLPGATGRSGTSSSSRTCTSAGATSPQPLPPFSPTVTVDGYRVTLTGQRTLHAIEPAFMTAHRHRPDREAADVHALVRRARARDLLPRRNRSTTSTRTSAGRTRPAARASSAGRA